YHVARVTAPSKGAAVAALAARLAEQRERVAEQTAVAAEERRQRLTPTMGEWAERWLTEWPNGRSVRPQTVGQYRATWEGTLSRTPVTLDDGREVLLRDAPVTEVNRRVATDALTGMVMRNEDGDPIDSKGRPVTEKDAGPPVPLR